MAAQFSWASFADVGIGAFTAYLGAKDERKYGARIHAAQMRTAKAIAAAENLVREGQNEVRSANRALASKVREINNNNILRNASDRIDAATRSALRVQDTTVRGSFEASVQGAEALGEQMARAAASGLGGAGIRAMSTGTSMRVARRQQALQELGEDQSYEAAQARAGIMADAYRGLQGGPLTAGTDVRQSVAQFDSGYQGESTASALIRGLFDKKDSLKTLLGSLVDDTPKAKPSVAHPVYSPSVTGTPIGELYPGAQAYPVTNSSVVGTPLAPITFN